MGRWGGRRGIYVFLHYLKMPARVDGNYQNVEVYLLFGLCHQSSLHTHCSKDLAYFDGLNEVILTAGLLKPKEGVFQEHIEYLLCLTTPVEIVVLGVSFTGVQRGAEKSLFCMLWVLIFLCM